MDFIEILVGQFSFRNNMFSLSKSIQSMTFIIYYLYL